MPEKYKSYTLQEIESFDIQFKKQFYTGRFYRKGNTLYVFEQQGDLIDCYLLKAILKD